MTYITLIQLHTHSYPLQKCYSITAWLVKWRRALILAKTDTLAAKYFVCTQSRRVFLSAYLQETVMHCGATWKIEWRHLPLPKHHQSCRLLCLSVKDSSNPSRTAWAFTHASKHQFRHMFTHINTDADEQKDYTLGRRAQPIKRALFSHLMILKMLVFHWLKHSKQTWRGDPTNKQAQSVFSAVNTAQCGSVTVICATAICVAASTARVCMCDRCVFLSLCHTVFSFVCVLYFLLADLCVCIFLHIFFYFYMCQRLYIHISACVFLRMFSGVCLCVSAFVCSAAGLEMWSEGPEECALCKLQMYVWKATSVFCSVSFRMTGPTTEEKYSLYFAPLAPLANV